MGRDAIAAQWDQARQAKEAYNRGDYTQMMFRGLDAAVPIVGPLIGNTADKIQAGRGVEAGADIAQQAVLAKAVPYGMEKLGLLDAPIKNVNTGVMDNALRSSASGYLHDRAGNLATDPQGKPIQAPVRLTPGERTGSQATQSLEQKLTNTRAQQFYEGQKQDMATRANAIAEQVSPQDTDAYGAGQALQAKLRGGINNLRVSADQDYNAVRAAAAQNPVNIKVGEKGGTPDTPPHTVEIENPLTGELENIELAPGKPGTPATPIYKTFHSPVDLKDYQTQVKPLYDELAPGMTDAQKMYSPAWQSLQDVVGRNMEDPNQRYMDPMLFDKHLGALKAITRGGKSDMLSTQGQGLAQQLLKNGESTLAEGLGPDAMNSLASGRSKVAAYYALDHELQALPKEPGALTQMFGRKKDVMADQLSRLNDIAPAQVQGLGRRVLEDLFEGSTKEGQFNPTKTLANNWDKLGDRTKELFYGKSITADIDKFMLTAQRAAHNYQPSGNVRSFMANAPLGVAALELVRAGQKAVTGDLHGAAMHAAGAVGGAAVAYTLPKMLSRLLFTPGGADLLTNALKSRPGTPQFFNAVSVLNTTMKNAQTDQENKDRWRQATGGSDDTE